MFLCFHVSFPLLAGLADLILSSFPERVTVHTHPLTVPEEKKNLIREKARFLAKHLNKLLRLFVGTKLHRLSLALFTLPLAILSTHNAENAN